MSFKTAFEEAGRKAWEKIVNDMPVLDEYTLDAVALDLCRRLFKMARWQGEANEHGACVSVGDHSILAGRLARIIAKAGGLSDEVADLAYRLGVTHDLGEVLGDLMRDNGIVVLSCGDQAVSVELRYSASRGADKAVFSLWPSGKATTGGKESALRRDCRSILQALGYEVRS